jgi:hypothetical protein
MVAGWYQERKAQYASKPKPVEIAEYTPVEPLLPGFVFCLIPMPLIMDNIAKIIDKVEVMRIHI